MGVFKEEVEMIEELMKRQKAMFVDSADYGVEATLEVKAIMRHVLKTLLPLKESRVAWKMDDSRVTQRQYKLTVYFSMEDGVTFNVLYYKEPKREFFSIDSKPAPSLQVGNASLGITPRTNPALYKEFNNVSDEELRTG